MKNDRLQIVDIKNALNREQTELITNIQADNNQLIQYLKASKTPIRKPFSEAGVLIPLVKTMEKWQVILTRRACHLKHHPGEIAFPGGRFETSDSDLAETAKRETFEEIGIEQNKIEILGQLPKQDTVSQYTVTPFVGIIKEDYRINLDPQEVDSAFTVPLKFLLNPVNQKKKQRTFNGQTYWYYEIQYNEFNIWGATAKMLVNFGKILDSINTQ